MLTIKTKRVVRPIGLGTMIKHATAKLGIRQCAGCKAREAKLNKIVRFVRPTNE